MRAVAEAQENRRQGYGQREPGSYNRPSEARTEPQQEVTKPAIEKTQQQWLRENYNPNATDFNGETFDWNPLMQQI